jgi:hypothetical protein
MGSFCQNDRASRIILLTHLMPRVAAANRPNADRPAAVEPEILNSGKIGLLGITLGRARRIEVEQRPSWAAARHDAVIYKLTSHER